MGGLVSRGIAGRRRLSGIQRTGRLRALGGRFPTAERSAEAEYLEPLDPAVERRSEIDADFGADQALERIRLGGVALHWLPDTRQLLVTFTSAGGVHTAVGGAELLSGLSKVQRSWILAGRG